MKETVRLNFDFPREDYPYLKMLCAEKGISFRQFATEIIIRSIEDYEDEILAQEARRSIGEMNNEDSISWNEARRLAGWTDDEEVQN